MRVVVNKASYPLEIKNTRQLINKGLAGRKELEGGAIFVFRDNRKRSFWMKGCEIPLDILFLTDNKVNKIHHNCPPSHDLSWKTTYEGEGNIALEFNGGFCKSNNIKEGDRLRIEK